MVLPTVVLLVLGLAIAVLRRAALRPEPAGRRRPARPDELHPGGAPGEACAASPASASVPSSALVVLWVLLWGDLSVANVLSGIVCRVALLVVFPLGDRSSTVDTACRRRRRWSWSAYFVAELVRSSLRRGARRAAWALGRPHRDRVLPAAGGRSDGLVTLVGQPHRPVARARCHRGDQDPTVAPHPRPASSTTRSKVRRPRRPTSRSWRWPPSARPDRAGGRAERQEGRRDRRRRRPAGPRRGLLRLPHAGGADPGRPHGRPQRPAAGRDERHRGRRHAHRRGAFLPVVVVVSLVGFVGTGMVARYIEGRGR